MPLSGRLFITSLTLALPVFAQKGSAPSGFYPSIYHGETFTGNVTDADDGDKCLVLQYDHGPKPETFIGTTESVCLASTKAGPMKELHLSAVPKGTLLTAFYNSETLQEGNAKRMVNSILAIRFDKVNGRTLNDPRRPVILCSKLGAAMSAY